LVLTDPPYGIQEKWVGGNKHGWGKAKGENRLRQEWDGSPPDKDTIDSIVSKGRAAIVWGGNYFELPPSRCWLVWNKPERNFTLAEAELAWTNADNVARVCDCNRHEVDRLHPTQKPVKLMKWCMGLPWASGVTVLDPFAGSGTTLVAAKQLGRKAVGIEIEEKYCEIAAQRLRQSVFAFD
jgi:site-specific DNA-methyltransferase (adenine-specific)